MSNILDRARAIVYDRSEEKERQYGPFRESMKRAAAIYNNMVWGAQATDIDMYKALIALKLSREGFAHKEDNLLDAIAYMASMNDALEEDAKNEKASAEKPTEEEIVENMIWTITPTQAAFDQAMDRLDEVPSLLERCPVQVLTPDGQKLVEVYVDHDDNLKASIHVWFNKKALDKLGINYELK